ncbi:MAG: tRNA (guanosine(46)-N7)-methyltransferase TrmB [Phycisphaerae bacterium]
MPAVETITVALDLIGDRADFAALFGRDAPVELEIGCGKGGFILGQARIHPERNYFCIEWANKYIRYAADRMARWGVNNVRLLRTDAKHFVSHRLAPASLTALHVYHPDPWPKKRHHKRRLFDAAFVEAAVRGLMPGARWAIQTDHEAYFEVIRTLTAPRPELTPVPFGDWDRGAVNERTETNFEIKYLREGRTIHRLAYRRTDDRI